jgi:hypothetical protein
MFTAQVVTKNGLIWDKHSLHYSDRVVKYISDSNKDPYNPTIISTLLDEGLALTIQVLDVAVNKVFKQKQGVILQTSIRTTCGTLKEIKG